MNESQEQGPIWPCYADLMTSLFAVALVLFVMSYWYLTTTYKVSAEKWQKVKEVETSVSALADKTYFVYQPAYKRHVFRQEVHFETGNSTILPEYRPFLQAAGNRIARLIGELRGKAQPGIKYLIIIEGMASRDGYANNFELSYQRALALYRLWQEMKIGFDSDVVEVIVAGSGTEGVGRYGPADETRNQRFLIQILPKVGAEGWR